MCVVLKGVFILVQATIFVSLSQALCLLSIYSIEGLMRFCLFSVYFRCFFFGCWLFVRAVSGYMLNFGVCMQIIRLFYVIC